MMRPLRGLGLAAMLVFGLVACSGDDGSPGAIGPTGPTGPAGPPGQDATRTTDVSTLTAEQWASLKITAQVTKVTIAGGPPVVEFKLSDANGFPITGLEKSTSKSSTATVASYPNLSFALSKLVPGKSGSPGEWVSYLVTTVPTTTAAAAPTRPSTDNTGKLEAVSAGSYKYTFYRDVTKIKDQVAAMTVTPPADKADLGDLTYDATLQHRLVMQVSGAARGTGSNTADGVTVAPTVNLENAVNAIFNFVPSTGAVIAKADLQKDVVNIASCNACHDRLAFHGGSGRVDTDYCTVCHTSQRAYGQTKVTSTNGAFPALTETKTVNAVTGITSYSYSPNVYVGDGEVMGHFAIMIHKIHQGGSLAKQNYNYANVAFNLKNFSMLDNGQRMCTVCHDTKLASDAGLAYSQPSRESCGACHDSINWKTGQNHVGGIQTDDSTCALCHKADTNKIYHQTTNLTTHNPTIQDGLVSFTYDIKEVKVNSTTNDVTIEFRILQQTAPSTTQTPVTFVPPAASVSNPLAGFTGGPSFLIAYALPQDGITTPAEYNNLVDNKGAARKQGQPVSISIAALLSTSNAANGSLAASTTAGYYIATLKGTGSWAFPVGAKMRAVALQGYFTQISPAEARHAISVVKPVTGDAVRRTIVDKTKCANCHEWFEGHGGNRVYETQVCVTCHIPALATSGRGVSDATMKSYAWTDADKKILTEWGVDINATNAALKFPVTSNNMKDMIHGIHAGRDRVVPFQDARDRTTVIVLLDFRRMDFPGTLSNCNMCHITAANSLTQNYNTIPAGSLVSVHESIDAAYASAIAAGTATPALAKTALNTANNDDSVVSPFTAACMSCHDNGAAKSHMRLNGGFTGASRSIAKGAAESCAVCHGPGTDFDAAAVHK